MTSVHAAEIAIAERSQPGIGYPSSTRRNGPPRTKIAATAPNES